MSLGTKSQWYYGHDVTSLNSSIDFDEGGGEIQATLNVNDYTLTEFVAEIQRALNAAGGQIYTCTVDRDTGQITISAASSFDLLISSGSRVGTGAWDLMGFTGADLTGATSYEGDSRSGKRYRPQFVLQDYISFEDTNTFVKKNVNESASGVIETVSFGRRNFMECSIQNITNLSQSSKSPVEEDLSARENVRDFLDYATKKAKMEFMEDRDTPATFTKCILESTSFERDGTGYQIKKMYNEGVPGYFETGTLEFRKVD